MQTSRDRRVYVRLNETERRAVQENADRLGTTVSGLIRALITMPIEIQQEALSEDDAAKVIVFDRKAIPELAKQVRMWGYHYDQAVRALNTIARARFMRADDANHYMGRATSLLEGIEESRRDLERNASELMLQARAYLPIGRDR